MGRNYARCQATLKGESMKRKSFIFLCILLFGTVTCQASIFSWVLGLFGGGTKVEVQNLKNSTEKSFSDIKAGVNDTKVGLNDLAAGAVKMTNDMSLIKDGIFTMNNKLQASVKANASIGQTLNTLTAGHDANSNSNSGNTNDSKLLKAIIGGILSTFSTIFLALIGYIKLLSNQKAKVDDELLKMSAARDEHYNELVAFQSKMLNDLMQSKEAYKKLFLDAVQKGE
jgi:hypothetical protein